MLHAGDGSGGRDGAGWFRTTLGLPYLGMGSFDPCGLQ